MHNFNFLRGFMEDTANDNIVVPEEWQNEAAKCEEDMWKVVENNTVPHIGYAMSSCIANTMIALAEDRKSDVREETKRFMDTLNSAVNMYINNSVDKE
jgi:phytoene/squalene synthetase